MFDMKDLRGIGTVEKEDNDLTKEQEAARKVAHQAYFGPNVTKEAWLEHLTNVCNTVPTEHVVAISVERNKKLTDPVDSKGAMEW